jgi:hypothetical protein
VHDGFVTPGLCWIVATPRHQKGTTMNKGKHGNKEAKKAKKVRVPNPPGLPAGLAPLVGNPLGPKKR